jgi:hypothetical protein
MVETDLVEPANCLHDGGGHKCAVRRILMPSFQMGLCLLMETRFITAIRYPGGHP